MECKTKLSWQLESPFNRSRLTKLSPEQENIIVDLLCKIVTPIGRYSLNHKTPSKGKRSKKRERKSKRDGKGALTTLIDEAPPKPEISSYVVFGLNIVLQRLEYLSNLSKIQRIRSNDMKFSGGEKAVNENKPFLNQHFSAIFIVSMSQPAIVEEILPQLVVTASQTHPELPETRLAHISKEHHNKLCECLNIPRVSIIGILDGAPFSSGLLEFIRKHVPEIWIPHLREPGKVPYVPVQINAVETISKVSAKRQKLK
ncbi:putative rna-processing protein [Golovinomyces cichoracearum]|uniref:Putative rna-processing protein n=1 Tax=Golovinomyces cichoracearum TaxID=62708 RepID=A0A420HLE1_9PEZI|nr:putative rna-processing protein [Golovinomyces cichoracearum]